MQAEAIYKGATRPAMKLGIPLVPLVILFGAGMLLIMWGGIRLLTAARRAAQQPGPAPRGHAHEVSSIDTNAGPPLAARWTHEP